MIFFEYVTKKIFFQKQILKKYPLWKGNAHKEESQEFMFSHPAASEPMLNLFLDMCEAFYLTPYEKIGKISTF